MKLLISLIQNYPKEHPGRHAPKRRSTKANASPNSPHAHVAPRKLLIFVRREIRPFVRRFPDVGSAGSTLPRLTIAAPQRVRSNQAAWGLGRENADVLRRPRIAFSSAQMSFPSRARLASRRPSTRRGRNLATPRFLRWRSAQSCFFLPLCVEWWVIWCRVGIGF